MKPSGYLVLIVCLILLTAIGCQNQVGAPKKLPPKNISQGQSPTDRGRENAEAPNAAPELLALRQTADRYGDLLPTEALARLGTVRFRHGASINSIAFTPDGKTIASASDDRSVRLWDVASAKQIAVLPHKSRVKSLAFAPDGKTLASGSDEGAQLWSTATGKVVRTLGDKSESVCGVVFSPDGKVLAATDGFTIRLWDLGTEKETHALADTPPGHWYGKHAIAFAPDGKTLASVPSNGAKIIHIWDLATGKIIRVIEGHQDWSLRSPFLRTEQPWDPWAAKGITANRIMRSTSVIGGRDRKSAALAD